MGEMIKMSVWVDVWPSSNEDTLPMIWTTPALGGISKGVKRYQINFEVPTFAPDITGTVTAKEAIELPTEVI